MRLNTVLTSCRRRQWNLSFVSCWISGDGEIFEVRRLFADGFVCEGLHCDPILCACWHDGSETVVSTTLRATLWKLSCFDGVRRSSSRFTVAVVRESASIFHTVDEDNQAVDSFVASSQSVAVPCSTGYLNVNTPRLFPNSSPTQLSFWSIPAMMSGVLGLPTIEAV